VAISDVIFLILFTSIFVVKYVIIEEQNVMFSTTFLLKYLTQISASGINRISHLITRKYIDITLVYIKKSLFQ